MFFCFNNKLNEKKTNLIAAIYERRRSPNANLAKTHNVLMLVDLFHSQNACVHCLVAFIRFIC